VVGLKLIVSSMDDPASVNARAQLLRLADFKEAGVELHGQPVLRWREVALITLKGSLLEADFIDRFLDAELAVFLSRHESSSRMPSLLAHVPGNWTHDASLGGRPRRLCRSPATALKEALRELAEQRVKLGLSSWRVGVEATHHGPFLEHTPAIFIEVGSSPEEWSHEAAGLALAKAALKAVTAEGSCRSLIGLGGPHYAPTFTQLLLEAEWAVSYIAPRYVVDEVDEEMMRQAVERSVERVEALALDWKGLKEGQRRRALKVADALRLKPLKVSELLKASIS
jgi:D-aminoacyl-tRNA deacylase